MTDVDRMLDTLEPVIMQKCDELRAARKERLKTRIFAILCAMVTFIPALLVFLGVSLTLLIAPLAFMSLSIILLLPVLLSGKKSEQGGNFYEQA